MVYRIHSLLVMAALAAAVVDSHEQSSHHYGRYLEKVDKDKESSTDGASLEMDDGTGSLSAFPDVGEETQLTKTDASKGSDSGASGEEHEAEQEEQDKGSGVDKKTVSEKNGDAEKESTKDSTKVVGKSSALGSLDDVVEFVGSDDDEEEEEEEDDDEEEEDEEEDTKKGDESKAEKEEKEEDEDEEGVKKIEAKDDEEQGQKKEEEKKEKGSNSDSDSGNEEEDDVSESCSHDGSGSNLERDHNKPHKHEVSDAVDSAVNATEKTAETGINGTKDVVDEVTDSSSLGSGSGFETVNVKDLEKDKDDHSKDDAEQEDKGKKEEESVSDSGSGSEEEEDKIKGAMSGSKPDGKENKEKEKGIEKSKDESKDKPEKEKDDKKKEEEGTSDSDNKDEKEKKEKKSTSKHGSKEQEEEASDSSSEDREKEEEEDYEQMKHYKGWVSDSLDDTAVSDDSDKDAASSGGANSTDPIKKGGKHSYMHAKNATKRFHQNAASANLDAEDTVGDSGSLNDTVTIQQEQLNEKSVGLAVEKAEEAEATESSQFIKAGAGLGAFVGIVAVAFAVIVRKVRSRIAGNLGDEANVAMKTDVSSDAVSEDESLEAGTDDADKERGNEDEEEGKFVGSV